MQSRGGGGGVVDCFVCTKEDNKLLLPIFNMEGEVGGRRVIIFWNSLGEGQTFQTSSGGGSYMFETAIWAGSHFQ